MNNSALARSKVSAFVVCSNEEDQIGRCLDSLSWCDEIVVVIDTKSTDRTFDIAKQYTERIFVREWPGFVQQKAFGLEQCRYDWVLNLDADEEVSEELKDELIKILERDQRAEVQEDGFELLRVVFFLGKWWRKGGWYPEFRLRFCRRSATSWGGDNPHERAIVDGKVGKLFNELRHYTYKNLADQIKTINKFSSTSAETLHSKGRRGSVADLLLRPPLRFLKFYFLRKGYREGRPGLTVACMEALYVYLKYLKLREMKQQRD